MWLSWLRDWYLATNISNTNNLDNHLLPDLTIGCSKGFERYDNTI